jgi:ABC-type phosphate transport system substrate-binding protein
MNTPSSSEPNPPPSRRDIDFSMNPRVYLLAAAVMLIGCWVAWYSCWKPFPVDSAVPHYTKAGDLKGTLVSVGSDTLADVMVLCSREFGKLYPDVTIQREHKGSATAPPALIDGKAQLAPTSRPMTAEEVGAFEGKYGYKPTFYKVALDALAVYVNKDGPILLRIMGRAADSRSW